ncbi:MAG: hypothetical protein GY715_21445, partial [Planctomycetes bacterium]|nr:hypothetical protein [Planctomycetota bacterium]
MTGRRWLRPLLALVSVMLVAGMAGQNVPDDPWGPLELIDVPTEAGRLRLDPALAAHRDVVCDRVVEAMRRHREQSAGPERLVARADEIVERVLEMLGEERDPRDERERRNAAQGLIGLIRATRFDLAPADELTIIVCLNDTVRGYLRRGGKLPHFVYDADTGTASYELRMQRHLSDTSAATEGFVLDLLPIGLESIDELDGWRPATGGGMDPGGLAVHEFVELAILDRIDPEQAHWRWFTDGLASAVAVRVLLDVGAMRARSQLLDSLDTSRFETWRGRSNLRYWPGIEYQVGRLVLPSAPALLPDEGALTLARYAFAFELVDGLVEPGGMEPMRRALTAMGAEPELQPHRIVEILAAETGVDVASLLLRHQSFATLEEGRGAYTEAFRTARAARDHLA